MAVRRLTPGASAGLLVVLLVGVGIVLAAMGSAVLIPQGVAVLIVVVAAVFFLGVQLLVFRALRLRSRADEEPSDEQEDDADWRAWRG